MSVFFNFPFRFLGFLIVFGTESVMFQAEISFLHYSAVSNTYSMIGLEDQSYFRFHLPATHI